MNQLSLEKRVQILNLLVEGNSMRSIVRLTGASLNTVKKLLVEIGTACIKFHNEKVVNLKSSKIECDEIWSFVYSKQRNTAITHENYKVGEVGDVWTWIGMDTESKLIISWVVGARDAPRANALLKDLKNRISSNVRVQLTTDALRFYMAAVEKAFGEDIDYAQLMKIYSKSYSKSSIEGERRYSTPKCIGTKKKVMCGFPDLENMTTNNIERQNMTMRMHMKRFARLSNAFSKKIENHRYAIALHFVYYNFCRIHSTVRVTPAMEAGLMDDIMTLQDIVKLVYTYPESHTNTLHLRKGDNVESKQPFLMLD